jgi:hypothetical protein
VTLVAPDAPAKREWLDTLVTAARTILRGSLPPPAVGGDRFARATILPVPGEITDHGTAMIRLKRIGKIGRSLLEQFPSEPASPSFPESEYEHIDEFRLFFAYLREDYTKAAAELESLEARTSAPAHRLGWLSLCAQIFAGAGQTDRARAIVEYLDKLQGTEPRRVEETPLGLVVAPVADPAGRWPRYLAQRIAERAASPRPAPAGNLSEGEAIENRLPHQIELINDWAHEQGAGAPRGPGGQRPNALDPIIPMRAPVGPQRPHRLFPPPPAPRPVQPVNPRLPRIQRPENLHFKR